MRVVSEAARPRLPDRKQMQSTRHKQPPVSLTSNSLHCLELNDFHTAFHSVKVEIAQHDQGATSL